MGYACEEGARVTTGGIAIWSPRKLPLSATQREMVGAWIGLGADQKR